MHKQSYLRCFALTIFVHAHSFSGTFSMGPMHCFINEMAEHVVNLQSNNTKYAYHQLLHIISF